jgi:hypothetical protein
MAAADNNVRPWRHDRALTARRARSSGLARLLLSLLELLHVDRKLLVLFAASLMPACIIPVGPEWQDPPGEENRPPHFLLDSDPVAGAEVGTLTTKTFRFSVTDPNANDETLFLRWIENYTQGGSVQHIVSVMNPRVSNNRPPQPTMEEISCLLLQPGVSEHRLKVVVSDREFMVDDPSNPFAVKEGGLIDSIDWTLNLPCPLQ